MEAKPVMDNFGSGAWRILHIGALGEHLKLSPWTTRKLTPLEVRRRRIAGPATPIFMVAQLSRARGCRQTGVNGSGPAQQRDKNSHS
jgi:hypothetical protein